MVTAVTNLGRSGLYDWLVQRASAVVLLVYFLFLGIFLLTRPELSFAEWRGLFLSSWMRLFSTLALLSLALHAWVGLWAVTTDYLTARTLGRWGTVLRLLAQAGVMLLLFFYLVLGLSALWGV